MLICMGHILCGDRMPALHCMCWTTMHPRWGVLCNRLDQTARSGAELWMCLAQFGTDERCIKVRHTPQHADSLLLSILPLCCTAWLVLLPYSIHSRNGSNSSSSNSLGSINLWSQGNPIAVTQQFTTQAQCIVPLLLMATLADKATLSWTARAIPSSSCSQGKQHG